MIMKVNGMAAKMQIEDVFATLLQGGYITSREYIQKKSLYTVHRKITDNKSEPIGHITEKQFITLCEKNIIEWTYEHRDMSDGSSIAWYDLPHRAQEKQREVIKNRDEEMNAFLYVRCATQRQIEGLRLS